MSTSLNNLVFGQLYLEVCELRQLGEGAEVQGGHGVGAEDEGVEAGQRGPGCGERGQEVVGHVEAAEVRGDEEGVPGHAGQQVVRDV